MPPLTASTNRPSATTSTEAGTRPARKYDGFKHVIKGRSYTEPLGGRPQPLVLQQGINGLVGKNKQKPFFGDIEGLKKRGFLIASAEHTVKSQRFVPKFRENAWRRPPEEDMFRSKLSNSVVKKHSSFIPLDNGRLYPSQAILLNRRKEGQCYSLMMQAKCQEQLFNAELNRAERVLNTTAFIRKNKDFIRRKSERRFTRYGQKDVTLLTNVKAFIKEHKSNQPQWRKHSLEPKKEEVKMDESGMWERSERVSFKV